MRFASVFSSGMVLQRDRALPVWGWARPGEAVTIRCAQQEARALADDDGNWATYLPPLGASAEPATWQARGCPFSGMLWFRKAVDLPAEWAGRNLALSIGATDKSDTTYVSNEKIGGVSMDEREDAWCLQRTCSVPGRLVRPGRNIIAVRVHSGCYVGGMTGPREAMQILCAERPDDRPIPLDGGWRYAVEANYGLIKMPVPPPAADERNAPSTLFNGMIAPLIPFGLRGVIWYQGESNTDMPQRYRALFPALMQDGRRQWGQGDFDVLFVQLTNYLTPASGPEESNWAEVREAQRHALRVPRTGMAVAIDLGEASDIHPRNKRDVGLRLAFHALHHTYGMRDVVPSGPLVRAAYREDRAVRLAFDEVDGGLVCRGEGLSGFELAGADRRFVAAHAKIDSDHVWVSHPDVAEPVLVRYAWANNPSSTLYNKAGLPASPFELEVRNESTA